MPRIPGRHRAESGADIRRNTHLMFAERVHMLTKGPDGAVVPALSRFCERRTQSPGQVMQSDACRRGWHSMLARLTFSRSHAVRAALVLSPRRLAIDEQRECARSTRATAPLEFAAVLQVHQAGHADRGA